MQRLRVRFGRGEEVKFIAHLDIVRFWERAFRRAEIPLAYSQGFTQHPRISLAAPLPVGVTSEFELMDVWLKQWMPPKSFLMKVAQQLPRGFEIFDVLEVGLHLPSLQSAVTFAEYHVGIKTEKKEREIQDSLDSLLQAKQLPWQHYRGKEVRRYDLRALIDNLWLISYHSDPEPFASRAIAGEANGFPENSQNFLGEKQSHLVSGELHEKPLCVLGMKLRCDTTGSGRPEQVISALSFPDYPEFMHRTRLMLNNNE